MKLVKIAFELHNIRALNAKKSTKCRYLPCYHKDRTKCRVWRRAYCKIFWRSTCDQSSFITLVETNSKFAPENQRLEDKSSFFGAPSLFHFGAPQPHLQLVAHLVAITVVFVRCQEKDKGQDEVEELRRLVSAPTQAVDTRSLPQWVPLKSYHPKPFKGSRIISLLGSSFLSRGMDLKTSGGVESFRVFHSPRKRSFPVVELLFRFFGFNSGR